MTEKVRIKSLIEETRIEAVNAATGSGHSASIQDMSEIETEDDEDEDEDDMDEGDEDLSSMSISLRLSKIYKRTLEILGDSLVSSAAVEEQHPDAEMTT